MKRKSRARLRNERGFTLLEGILAVVVIGLLAIMAVPRIGSTDKHVLEITLRQLIADMRYARSLAITRPADGDYKVTFYPSGGPYRSYKILKAADDTEVKATQIPEQVTLTPLGDLDSDPEPPDVVFTSLGNIQNISGDSTIIRLTVTGHQRDIAIVIATGRMYEPGS